ncbi:putative endo-1,3(4)-beta-glucanase [Erysiphe necator]|nr:putative endo-1,3(4)-beta-glucanase [Erysiphe necator]
MKLFQSLILILAVCIQAKPLEGLNCEKPCLLTSPKAQVSSSPTLFSRVLSIDNKDEDNSFIGLTVPSENSTPITSAVLPEVSLRIKKVTPEIVRILPPVATMPALAKEQSTYKLDMNGHTTKSPLIQTSIPVPPANLEPLLGIMQTMKLPKRTSVSQNIFQPVATSAPPSVFSSRPDHPVPRTGIKPQKDPLQTNKFYASFFLGNQTARTWTHPYSVAWAKGEKNVSSWGMSIMHLDANAKVFDQSTNPPRYFLNPLGILSIIVSSSELSSTTYLSIDSLTSTSANVNLHPNSNAPPQITFPLVQGMGFVTAIFHNATPILQSTVLFRNITKSTTAPKSGVSKFKITLEDSNIWFLYAYSSSGAKLEFQSVSNQLLQATTKFDGILQIAKNPPSNVSAEKIYDTTCGAYATSVNLTGSVNGDSGSYTFSFIKGGMPNTTLAMFALPHHVSSFSPDTSNKVTDVQLETTTKGKATAVIADSWTMIEKLPTSLEFKPWNPQAPNEKKALSANAVNSISKVANVEISQDMANQTNLDSVYYSGKALAKFASIAYTLKELLGDEGMAQAGLKNLKSSFSIFTSNKNKYPLVYETAWKGIVSTATYTNGDKGLDFGNTCYNDHHFHYGYFILAAALIGSIDPSWAQANKDYINTLVRDIANPSSADTYFPVSRCFDWYHGHSWAHGLFETYDGKDQESSSEDSMSAYALKMWGKVIGDANLEARGNLQLAINARSLQNYYLFEKTNKVEPANFIGNKVAGILFENKIDHITYFGAEKEYIQGIHMIPILPSSALTRTRTFVQEEWETYFSNGRADAVKGGWKGILYANLALIDPKTAWNYFNSANFDMSTIDGGASRTWYMAFAAGLGGCD